MTLLERYQQAKNQPLPISPGASFIQELATVTKKSEVAVRRWLSNSNSRAIPDALTQEVLAQHFGTTPEELFPKQ